MRRLATGLLALSALTAACGGPVATPPSSTTSSSTPSTTTTTTDPGLLPQTEAQPSSSSAGFAARMAALWTGIQDGSAAAAEPAFFPETAYRQVKAIADPAGDYRGRLLGEFALDVGAAHALLGADAATATLVGVEVPAAYAHWVTPGTCFNRVGYYEVPNARLLYREQGVERSFGIASLISWRGEWYVVHLGAVVRSGTGGAVDAPADGPGVSAPSSTC